MSVTSYTEFTEWQKAKYLTALQFDLAYLSKTYETTQIRLEAVTEINQKQLRANGMEHQRTLEGDLDRTLRLIGLVEAKIAELDGGK